MIVGKKDQYFGNDDEVVNLPKGTTSGNWGEDSAVTTQPSQPADEKNEK